jgi:hypothetical protein
MLEHMFERVNPGNPVPASAIMTACPPAKRTTRS